MTSTGTASGLGNFAMATAVTRIDDADGSARYSATVHDGWDIGGNANGGYVLAMVGRAMADALGRPPLTITAHYLRPVGPGEAEIVVDTIRAGRRLATATATMMLGGKAVLQVLGTFGDPTPGGPSLHTEAPIDLPSWADCTVAPALDSGPKPALMQHLDVRMRPGDEGFRSGAPTGDPEFRGWFSFRDAEPIDAIGLLLVADAFPPPIFHTDIPMAWVPTVELTVHVRAEPAPGLLRCRFRSRFIGDGFVDEDGEMWDSEDRLVAQSRQLSLMPRS